jgi:acylphosphatase
MGGSRSSLGRAGSAVPKAVHVRIGGRVQGVGFRYFALREAQEHGVTGWVRNLSDGGVEARVEGSAEKVNAFLASLREGPRMSRVEEFDVRDVEATETFRRFEVRY